MIEVWLTTNDYEPCASCACKIARQPEGYVEWHEWAERKSRRHKQIKCPRCGCFTWVRKEKEETEE